MPKDKPTKPNKPTPTPTSKPKSKPTGKSTDIDSIFASQPPKAPASAPAQTKAKASSSSSIDSIFATHPKPPISTPTPTPSLSSTAPKKKKKKATSAQPVVGSDGSKTIVDPSLGVGLEVKQDVGEGKGAKEIEAFMDSRGQSTFSPPPLFFSFFLSGWLVSFSLERGLTWKVWIVVRVYG